MVTGKKFIGLLQTLTYDAKAKVALRVASVLALIVCIQSRSRHCSATSKIKKAASGEVVLASCAKRRNMVAVCYMQGPAVETARSAMTSEIQA